MNTKVIPLFAALALVAPSVAAPAERRAALTPTAYVKAIKAPYLQLRTAFLAALGPCGQNPSPKRCEPKNIAATAAAQRFSRTLARTTPPARLARGHRLLVSGTAKYIAAGRKQLKVVRAGGSTTEGFFPALGDLNSGVVLVNAVVPRALPMFYG